MKRVLHRQHAWNEEQMRKLDAQGRHRSEWCYAPYDGRKVSPPKNGADDESVLGRPFDIHKLYVTERKENVSK